MERADLQSPEGVNGKKEWRQFSTELERDAEFDKLKRGASRSGCGPMCDCFYEYNKGKSFRACYGKVEIIENLKLAD
jgi:hypothetical protein